MNNAFPTSAMGHHQKSYGSSTNSSDAAKNNIPDLFQKHHDNDVSDSITEDDLKDTILNFFITGNIPFNQMDSPHFQKIISMIRIKGK